uniref:NADH-ubiquinone oxidoreductase chain 4 n=1 Tax=Thaumastocoris safordi TaxID=1589682 RepID=A0A8T9ZXV1_9HEMI|nr:NADH dehydrogenase subunit 4 [Thaumastocoris safordi]
MMKLMMLMFFMFPFMHMISWWCLCLLSMFLALYTLLQYTSYYTCYLSYIFGMDQLSMLLISLSFWIISLMFMASTSSVKFNNNDLFYFKLILYFLMFLLFLSFSSTNLLGFYFFFEASLIPTLILIFGWGYQPERLVSGYYLLFYTLFFSLPLLVMLMYIGSSTSLIYFMTDELDMNIYIYLVLFCGFLVKMPMVLVHFWLPKAHVEAPISGSMILAAVLLKLGGYGILRFTLFCYSWVISFNYVFISLSLVGMCYISLMCLYQIDMKSLIAYSSVAHMSMVICGLFSNFNWGYIGSIILMVAHGLCSSAMFVLANISYERTSTRSLILNKGMMTLMPSMSLFWFLFSVNNMAAPPSLNLLGELMLIVSVMGYCTFGILMLSLMSFLSCCYSIYLYSMTQHGMLSSNIITSISCSYNEY